VTSPHPHPRSTSDASANLDLLRSLAVVFVVVSHLPEAAGVPVSNGTYHLQALGLLGVGIFFIHTTLVLMLSVDRQSGGQ
jgi:peptidoglycan/LPS O-acetylase OafA/YrhL